MYSLYTFIHAKQSLFIIVDPFWKFLHHEMIFLHVIQKSKLFSLSEPEVVLNKHIDSNNFCSLYLE